MLSGSKLLFKEHALLSKASLLAPPAMRTNQWLDPCPGAYGGVGKSAASAITMLMAFLGDLTSRGQSIIHAQPASPSACRAIQSSSRRRMGMLELETVRALPEQLHRSENVFIELWRVAKAQELLHEGHRGQGIPIFTQRSWWKQE